MRRLDQFLRDLAVDARRADIEAGGEEEAAALEIELDLGVHRHLVRELDLPPARGDLDCAHVAGGPGRSEEILRGRVASSTR